MYSNTFALQCSGASFWQVDGWYSYPTISNWRWANPCQACRRLVLM